MADLYRRKAGGSVEVNRLTKENAIAVTLWCGGVQVEEIDVLDPGTKYVGINVPTLHGMARASEGDYIIKGEHGDFWPCKEDQFYSTYEKVD